jgi:hypothetical protein
MKEDRARVGCDQVGVEGVHQQLPGQKQAGGDRHVPRAYRELDPDYESILTLSQGNLSDQRQVTVFDPVHDTVRAALETR